MSSHDIVVPAGGIELLRIAPPNADRLWRSIEEDADGRHALLLGSLDDAIIMPGSLGEIEQVGVLIGEHVKATRKRLKKKARKAAKKAQRKAAAVESPGMFDEAAAAGDLGDDQTPYEVAPKGAHGGFVEKFMLPHYHLLGGGHISDGNAGVTLVGDVELVGTPAELGELGEAITTQFGGGVKADAVEHLAQVCGDLMSDAGFGFASFTCTEADSLARMLAVHGYESAAVNVIFGHAESDDHGDAHGYIQRLKTGQPHSVYEATQIYLRRLCGDMDAMPKDADSKQDALRDLELEKGPADQSLKELLDGLEIQQRENNERDGLILGLKQELGIPVDLP